MHRVVAGERHARKNFIGLAAWNYFAGLQRIADNLVLFLGIDSIIVEGDPGAARRPLRLGRAEPPNDIGPARSVGVL
jgi:hypothetical protein